MFPEKKRMNVPRSLLPLTSGKRTPCALAMSTSLATHSFRSSLLETSHTCIRRESSKGQVSTYAGKRGSVVGLSHENHIKTRPKAISNQNQVTQEIKQRRDGGRPGAYHLIQSRRGRRLGLRLSLARCRLLLETMPLFQDLVVKRASSRKGVTGRKECFLETKRMQQ